MNRKTLKPVSMHDVDFNYGVTQSTVVRCRLKFSVPSISINSTFVNPITPTLAFSHLLLTFRLKASPSGSLKFDKCSLFICLCCTCHDTAPRERHDQTSDPPSTGLGLDFASQESSLFIIPNKGHQHITQSKIRSGIESYM
jgi:hypothetical protein